MQHGVPERVPARRDPRWGSVAAPLSLKPAQAIP